MLNVKLYHPLINFFLTGHAQLWFFPCTFLFSRPFTNVLLSLNFLQFVCLSKNVAPIIKWGTPWGQFVLTCKSDSVAQHHSCFSFNADTSFACWFWSITILIPQTSFYCTSDVWSKLKGYQMCTVRRAVRATGCQDLLLERAHYLSYNWWTERVMGKNKIVHREPGRCGKSATCEI